MTVPQPLPPLLPQRKKDKEIVLCGYVKKYATEITETNEKIIFLLKRIFVTHFLFKK